MQTMGQVHLPLWNLHICIRNFENLAEWDSFHDDFHSLDNPDYGSICHFALYRFIIRKYENLADWNFCRKYESSDYGPVHMLLWSLDDFHSLDNANSRSAPSATMKHRWFSFFGQPRLWVGSIYHFDTYRFIVRNYENLADWSFLRKWWFLQQLFLRDS